jgi:tetratricopeptide (TPR) repeat protein
VEATGSAVEASIRNAFEQAVALLRQKQYSEVVDVLSPVVAEHPELPGPLVNLAVAYIHLERQEQAMAALQQALAAEPEHPAALNWLAILKRREGQFEEARSLYQRLLAAHPESRYGHLNLGILCDLYLHQADCALKHYRRYQELAGGEDADVKTWIADLERRQRQG